MSDREDGPVPSVQAFRFQSTADLVPGHASGEQLRSRDDAVLTGSDLSDRLVGGYV